MKLPQGDKGKLSDKQLDALEYLKYRETTGITVREIAKKIDVSERSIFRWLQDVNFQAVLITEQLGTLSSKLPKVYESIINQATKGNMKAAELLLKSFGLLTDNTKVEVSDTTETSADLTSDIDRLMKEIKDLDRYDDDKAGINMGAYGDTAGESDRKGKVINIRKSS